MNGTALHGLLAEFDRPEGLIEAVRRAREEGYRRMDAFSPLPLHGIAEEMGATRGSVAFLFLAGGILGGVGGFLLQYYGAAVDYPILVGGRPLNSWPAFIPITFEMTVLGGALTGLLGMLARNGLPRLHHPVFGVPSFGLASRSRFFLEIEAADPRFDRDGTRRFLEGLGALGVSDVPA